MNRRDLAAAYLLDALDPAEGAEVERRLAEDPELRAEVAAMRALGAQLDALPEAAWPVAGAASAAGGSWNPEAEAGGAAPRTARRWAVRPVLAIGALVVVAALAFGLGALLTGGNSSPTAPTIVLRPLRPASGEEATVAMPAPGEMLFRAEGLPPLEPGQYYEIWLMSSASRLVPVASFRAGADGRAQVRVPLPADPSAYRYFDVSRQQVGDGTRHSADSVLRGRTS